MDKEKVQLSQEQIDQCIAILETLNNDANQISEIPKERRIELMIQAGRLSRPLKDEFKERSKNSRKIAKRRTAPSRSGY